MKQLREIFDIKYGVNLELINCDIVSKGQAGVPFISRTGKNNGISAFVEKIEGVDFNPPHTISVAVSGSVGESFYHNYQYYSGRDVYVLSPKRKMSAKEMLFYCQAIKKNKYKFNYGRQANRTLPYLYVPSRIPGNFNKIKCPAEPVEKALISKTISLNIGKWKFFVLGDIFSDIRRGSESSSIEYEEGGTPLISATMENNGVKQYVRDGNEIIKGNIITIPVMGEGAGQAFYQKNKCYVSGNVNILRADFLNEYVGLFLSTLIRKERIRLSYGRILNMKRLRELKIKLPVDKDRKPDWKFMEDYIKSLPYSASL